MIRDNYLCQNCLDVKRFVNADVVDHTLPISLRWDLRLTLNNLRSLCHACHNAKTAEDKRRYE
ncbi:HNH endonuclease [Paenibacillus sp. J5C_2022]|nr:HNH endonuclease [Paenibacillus sp. J5C2022]MCU6709413.1 HNH endonuclease [Paenibacillus sp. J5C2022]